MVLEELDIVIDVVDSFSEEIDELLADLETVDYESGKVDDIWIDVDVLGDEEIATLQSELASLTDEQLIVDADVRGEGELLNFAALKEAVAADEISEVNFKETGLDQIIAKTAVANSQVMALRGMAGGIDFGGMGGDRYGGEARGDIPEGGLLSLRMSDLHNAMAKLIPLVLVYVGALPAAIGGLLGLATAAASAAAALGALTGLAGYGFALQAGDGDAMQGLQEITDRIQEDFADAFEPLARDLAPLFEDALDGLERFFDTLASHGDILRSLTDDARAFGAFMSEYIVGIATTMGTLADTATPLFALLGDVVRDLDLIEGFAGFLAQTLPALVAFGDSLADIIVRISEFSVGILAVSAVLTNMIDIILWVVSGFGLFEEEIGAVIGALLGLLTIGSILYSFYAGQFLNAIYASAASLYSMGIASIAAAAKQKVLAAATAVLQMSMWQLAAAVAAATAGLSIILALGSSIVSQFGASSDAIDDATDSLKEFQNLQGDVDGMGGGDSVVYQFAPTSQRTTINEQNVQDAYRTVKTKQFNDADVPS